MTPSRRARRSLALAVLAGLTLTGCGAGIDAQTDQRRTFSEGSHEVLPGGQILINNFYVAPPEQEDAVYDRGENARAYAVFVNQGDTADRLVRITSPVASRVTFWAGGSAAAGVAEHTEEFTEVFDPSRAARPGGTDNRAIPGQEQAEEGAEGVAAAAPSAPAEASGAEAQDGQQLDAFEIPVAEKLEVLPGAGYILFEGLREEIYPGTTFEVTVEFEQAGSHTFPAYVHVLAEPAERETPGSAKEGIEDPGSDQPSDLEQ